jgi:hypothetical protein
VTSVSINQQNSPATAAITVTAGQTLVVDAVCLAQQSITVTDSFGDSVISAFTMTATGQWQDQVFLIPIGTGGSDTITFTGALNGCGSGTFPNAISGAVDEYNGITAAGASKVGTAATVTGVVTATTSQSMTLTGANSIVYEIFHTNNGGGGVAACATIGYTTGQTPRDALTCYHPGGNTWQNGFTDDKNYVSVGSVTQQVSWNTGVSAINSQISYQQAMLELVTTLNTITATTACLGNCGNPAVTLASTNSTQGMAFNNSLTIFYSVQSSLNGFLLNMTTNIGKTYSNGQTVTLGIYIIPACPAGVVPFSSSCPGLLQASSSFTNPAKGQISLLKTNIPVFTGEWIGLAVSAQFAPIAINDTNTVVPISQTNGIVPASITQSSTLATCSCKTGIWGYVNGNTINLIPPPNTGQNQCGGLDCILTGVVNSFCTNLTTACQTSSAMFWTIILTIITIMTVAFGFTSIIPSVNLGRTGLAEISVLVFIMWIAIFTSFSLMSFYVLALVFMAVAILFGRKLSGYVGV